jgi:hypothetical protein
VGDADREMDWSTHCNSEVVRWSLREYGVTLAGPGPRELVDEIPSEVLRAKMRSYAPQFPAGTAQLGPVRQRLDAALCGDHVPPDPLHAGNRPGDLQEGGHAVGRPDP